MVGVGFDYAAAVLLFGRLIGLFLYFENFQDWGLLPLRILLLPLVLVVYLYAFLDQAPHFIYTS